MVFKDATGHHAAPFTCVMHSIRSVKAYYFAAFILGALIALLVVAPARSTETLHLDPESLVQLTAS
jgi:hypothetical protein